MPLYKVMMEMTNYVRKFAFRVLARLPSIPKKPEVTSLGRALSNRIDPFRRSGVRVVVSRVPGMRREIRKIFNRQIDQRLFHRFAVA